MNLIKRILPGPGPGPGNGARALVAAGDRARDARDWPAAAAHYRQALDAAPALPAIWVQYGHALKESGQLAAARDAYRRAAAMAPEVADTHLQMGHAAKIAGDLGEAAACYVQALSLQPDYDDALRELQALSVRGVRVDVSALRGQWGGDAAAAAPGDAPADAATATDTATDTAGQLARAQSALAAMLEQARSLDDGGAAAAPAHTPAHTPEHALAARQAREQLASAVEILRKLDARALAPIAADTHGDSHGDAHGSAGRRAAAVVFDATDLIHHFRRSRLPTGIQRVQLEMISAAGQPGQPRPRVCYLGADGWLEAPAGLFVRLCRMCLDHADTAQAEWEQAMMQLDLLMHDGGAMAFPRGAWLVSLGTSWFPDYLLHVRLARREHGIRYVPFVHDLIPVVLPEYCVDDLVDRFFAWLLGVFTHADHFLVNSESTRRDLVTAAARLGHHLPDARIEVVRLDADIRKPARSRPDPAAMRAWDWGRQPFVLMLSTVEPRKNHLAALRAWRDLIGQHGARRVPQLVCVGGKGWKNEAVFAMLDADPLLASRVTMLSGLADAQLALLFERCLFTLYPSFYEGWGLPVTESLCYGKVPLVSDVASLPEAGGQFAHYFDPHAPADLLQALERLTFDLAYREARELRIRAEFRPRTWQQLGAQIARALSAWDAQPEGAGRAAEGAAPDPAPCAPRLLPARYYPLATQRAPRLRHGVVAGENLRAGNGWHSPEPWGCWSRPGESRLALHLHEDLRGGPVRVYLGVRAMPGAGTRYRLEMGDTVWAEGELEAGQTRWIATDMRTPATPGQPLEIFLHSSHYQALADSTDGADQRVIGPAVLGLYLCAAHDVAARLQLVEAVALGSLDTLTGPAEAHDMAAAAHETARETAQLLAGL
ncbi:glycosyltransferase family 1 protein [Cupriavidus sp. WS]|uniref:glycosyltransferase family 4 protein n=1 Tax=Cupriavidus sp. WS TaxID=1312922 RepID=UPI0003A723C7|nr:glycosyltransferase [Cupriavidus sp. WS]